MRDSKTAARLVLLVTVAVFINYLDRGNLSTAAPLIQAELHLSATQLGILLAAFYYSYVLCMPATGWLAERFGAKSVLAAGITVWSLAMALSGFARGFASLLTLQLLLDVCESVAFNILGFMGWVFLLPVVHPLDWAAVRLGSRHGFPRA